MTPIIQGTDEIVIDADIETVWGLLEHGDRLTDFAFMVKRTSGGREQLGAVRRCEVELDGRGGQVAERCIELVPQQRIAWMMIEDSFGFGRMFADMGFSFALEPRGDGTTTVRNESFYRPVTLMARVASRILMRRKFRAMRRKVLANLKAVAEREARRDSTAGTRPSRRPGAA